MILIFTGNEQLDKELNKAIKNSRVVYYTDYILEEEDADILIATVQNNKYNFKDLMFGVRKENIEKQRKPSEYYYLEGFTYY